MADIIPIIMNTRFQRVAAVDDYSSLIWTSRYNQVGDFELCVPASTVAKAMIQKGFYVVRDDDENVGIVEDIKFQYNEDASDTAIISGRFLAALLGRRIIAEQTTVEGKISGCINTLINQNVMYPSIMERSISNFILGSYDIAPIMKAQYTGKNLLETISEICVTYGIGFKVILNSSNQFVFQLYEGTDRTYDQQVNPWVIFSDKYDNLLSSEYEENYQNIATAVLVAGEGEGLDRKTKWVTDDQTGINRYEVYKDQRNLRSNDGDITDAEYEQLLEESGKESLTKYTTAFSGNVYFGNIKYKQDVNLGDLCVIENSEWNVHINCRLLEVIESVNEAGKYNIIPTFGM